MVARPGPRTSTIAEPPASPEALPIPVVPTVRPLRTYICSPYRGDQTQDPGLVRPVYEEYLRRCFLDSLENAEAPFAPHGFYTLYLSDSDPRQRQVGLGCALSWLAAAELVATYVDYGRSEGMREDTLLALSLGLPVEVRRIGTNDRPSTDYGLNFRREEKP